MSVTVWYWIMIFGVACALLSLGVIVLKHHATRRMLEASRRRDEQTAQEFRRQREAEHAELSAAHDVYAIEWSQYRDREQAALEAFRNKDQTPEFAIQQMFDEDYPGFSIFRKEPFEKVNAPMRRYDDQIYITASPPEKPPTFEVSYTRLTYQTFPSQEQAEDYLVGWLDPASRTVGYDSDGSILTVRAAKAAALVLPPPGNNERAGVPRRRLGPR